MSIEYRKALSLVLIVPFPSFPLGQCIAHIPFLIPVSILQLLGQAQNRDCSSLLPNHTKGPCEGPWHGLPTGSSTKVIEVNVRGWATVRDKPTQIKDLVNAPAVLMAMDSGSARMCSWLWHQSGRAVAQHVATRIAGLAALR